MTNSILASGERFFAEERTTTFRKEVFTYIHRGIIDEAGDTWTTTELDETNISQVYNQYRVKHGIPFPDEIAALRRHYGLSAVKMSQILGFGINQYRMYEDGEVPNISNARTIMAAREKDVLLSFVEASKDELSENEYVRIKNKIEAADSHFMFSGVPSVLTGYRALSIIKVASVAKMIISKIGPTFVTKMNKLLFYTDFLHYKKHGFGITGLTYRALQFGPVPQSWGTVYESISGVSMNEFVYPNGQSGILLENISEADKSILSVDEISTIERVCELFSDMTAGKISNESHKEVAWLANCSSHSEISYQYSFSLNYD